MTRRAREAQPNSSGPSSLLLQLPSDYNHVRALSHNRSAKPTSDSSPLHTLIIKWVFYKVTKFRGDLFCNNHNRNIIISAFRKKHREGKQFGQGHRAGNWQGQDLNRGRSAPECTIFTATPC